MLSEKDIKNVGFVPKKRVVLGPTLTQKDCDDLNLKLASALEAYEPYTLDWFYCAKEFHDKVTRSYVDFSVKEYDSTKRSRK